MYCAYTNTSRTINSAEKRERWNAGILHSISCFVCNLRLVSYTVPCPRGEARILLLLHHGVAAHELIYATCGVDQFSLTRIEWVRC